jgi:hypothetical protein
MCIDNRYDFDFAALLWVLGRGIYADKFGDVEARSPD